MFRLNLQSINFNKVIGSGNFGNVYPYQKSPDDDKWVVKIQHSLSKQLPQKIQEIVLGFSFDHPNVLPIKGFNIDYKEDRNNWEICIKMPRMVGSLRSRLNDNIKDKKYFLDKEIIQYFYDITCGVTYLHQKKIVHRDIKLDNILLNKNGSAVISDVGLGDLIEDQSSYFIQETAGALIYLAPEVLEAEEPLKKKDLYKADAWSLGLAIAELCLLKTNFLKPHLCGEQKEAKLTEQLEAIRGQYHDSSFIDLILMLLKHSPDKRISAIDMKKKLEEKYENILNVRDRAKSAREGLLSEENKSPMLISQESHYEIKSEETSPEISRVKIETTLALVNEELERSKDESLKSKKERLQFLIQEIESQSTLSYGGEKLFDHIVNKCDHLSGVCIRPKDPSKINDEHMKELIENLTMKLNQHNLSQLELLSLEFGQCKKITDNTLDQLAVELGIKLKNLKSLVCEYHCDKLTDKGVNHLAAQIGNNLKELEYLFIYIKSSNLTDGGAQQLLSQVANNIKNLQQLGLSFEQWQISDNTIFEMIKYLPNNFQNLTTFYLYFRYCSKITEDTFIQLVNQIASHLQNLQTFCLALSGCDVSDKILYKLAEHFENSFHNLKDCHLSFSDCKKINDKAVLELVQKSSLKKLHTLELNFRRCTQITDQAVRSLGPIIEENLKKIQILILSFDMVPVSEDTKKLLKESLKYIPKLTLKF